ncbi:MAG: integrase [Cycloclasticus sp.]|nr:MAG: integrase [Cycloclasticus sp.]
MKLFNIEGKRLYLTAEERTAFYNAACKAPRTVRTFCHTLLYTGCRISEALALTYGHVDVSAKHLVFRTLKKRSKTHHRAVPIPDGHIDALDMVHGVQEAAEAQRDTRLWSWTRQHAWYLVKGVMRDAGIDTQNPYATPKGLRHSFGIHAVNAGVPLNEIQKLMGHADIKTTAIYLDAVDDEKRVLVSRMW